ncbi:hypothetical protein H6F32_04235 [Anabaena sp. FACHB-1237]|uniref:hypothetical protein n=1 Tax=Anabaena sp. FACHB-1237 TaxID=2692769 RepID=UPI001681348F|nr:hypothetical protein [Anabaena sp. FACHB-1237]MBD2136816.1 hypothetical protein [Anabaena sp. FACHB-1237]
MQHLHQLLKVEKSQLAEILRFNLHGLLTTLNKANEAYPLDPGTEICQELIAEIQQILEIKIEPISEILESFPTQEELKSTNLLINLKKEFNDDPKLKVYLGTSQIESDNDPDIWNEIHRKLLRFPEDIATYWQEKAVKYAAEVGANADDHNLKELPFVRDEIIYPGLNGTIKVKGLCLSHKALLNSGITKNYSQSSSEKYLADELELIAGFLLLYIKFMEIEPDLNHALKSVFTFDIISLNSNLEQKQQYIDTFSDRFYRTQKSAESGDILLNLNAWIDIDEAINSLVFIPPAERYSWWGKLQKESRRILKRIADQAVKAGHDVKLKQLSGLYADVCEFSKDDLQLDSGGNPGEVLTCLRVYAKINQEEFPGRVIFRTLR